MRGGPELMSNTERSGWRPQTLAELSDRAKASFGDRIAIIDSDGEHTFRFLAAAAARLSTSLATLGIHAGDRVILHLPNGWEWSVAYYAILRMGAVIVPANFLLSRNEVQFIAADSGAALVITTADRQLEDIPCILTDSEGPVSFAAMLDAPESPAIKVGSDDLATIGYTSGTTGKPKGALLSHRSILSSTAMTATIHMRQADETVFSALPMSHVYGNIVLNAAFLVGMSLVTTRRFDVGDAFAAIEHHRATLFEGVPTMYYQMLADPRIGSADFSSLTRCTVGGQTMPQSQIEAVEARFGCPLLELWGMTEVGGPAISHSPLTPARPGSIGLPFPGMEARIVNGRGQLAGQNEPGELEVRGPLCMQGYHENPAATAEATDADGWLRTGDIATCDQDGYYYIVDRKKDMLITGGYNVYPAEIEQAIASHPSVSMVAVIGIADGMKGELAKAYVVRKADTSLSEGDLVEFCRASLAAYKIPRVIVFVDELPRTSTGKISRQLLREALGTDT